jgi:hypothetical protein
MTPTPRSVLDWFARNPSIGLLGTLASILSIPLGIYLYEEAKPTRELIVTADPAVAIAKAGQTSSVDVLFNGQKITTDVYIRQLYIWNAGSESVRSENVLEPIEVQLLNARILEVRLKKMTRPLTGVSVRTNGENRVMCSWKILEHNDGAVFDVIYAAPDAGKIETLGTIEHQGEVPFREYIAARDTWLRGWKLTAAYLGFAGCSTLMLITGIVLGVSAIQTGRSRKLKVAEIVAACVLVAGLVGLGAFGISIVAISYRTDIIPPAL